MRVNSVRNVVPFVVGLYCSLAATSAVAQCLGPALLRHDGGTESLMYVSGTTLYAAQPNLLTIRNVATPAAPVVLGTFYLDGRPQAMERLGNYLYVALEERGVQIIDVSNAAAPVSVFSIAGGTAVDLAVSNNKLFIAWNDDLRVYDVTNPLSPTFASTYASPNIGDVKEVESRGNIAYLMGTNAVESVDCANAAAPVSRDTLVFGSSTRGMDVRPGLMAVASTAGFHIVDISNPSNLIQRSQPGGGSSVVSYFEFGQINATPVIYFANVNRRIDGYSLADPANPDALLAFPAGSDAQGLAADNAGNVFAGLVEGTFSVYQGSLTVPATQIFSQASTIWAPRVIGQFDNSLAVAEDTTLRIYNVTNPLAPTLTSTTTLPASSYRATITGSMLCSHEFSNDRLYFYDMSNPASPQLRADLLSGESVSAVASSGSLVYALGDRLKVFDVSNPLDPYSTGSVGISDSVYYMDAGPTGAFAWPVLGTAMKCVDASDPALPVVASTLQARAGHYWDDVATFGKYLFTLQSDNIVDVYDVSNMAAPVIVASFQAPFGAGALDVAGSLLIVSNFSQALADVVDIADPTNPILLPQKLRTSYVADNVTSKGTTAWMSAYGYGIDTFRLPGQPRLTAPIADAPACIGGTSTLRVTLADATGATYRWRKNNVNLNNGATGSGTTISGVFSDTLTLTSTGLSDIGNYDCVITNACGTTTTADARLFIGAAPTIVIQPQGGEVCPQGSITLTTGWIGSNPATFQWQVENPINSGTYTNLADTNAPRFTRRGTNTRSMTIAAKPGESLPPVFVQSRYRCIVTNACASATSQPALVTVGQCDCIDFNNNSVFPEDQDVIDYFDVLSGATCATCNDIDFNNNSVFPEDQDVIDFFTVLAGGPCS